MGLKNAYAGARGATTSRGVSDAVLGPIFPAGFQVPRTKWGDVAVVAAHLKKYIDPDFEQCVELLSARFGSSRATSMCLAHDPNSPREFARTVRFERAKQEFAKHHPYTVGGMAGALRKIALGEVYPHNEQFWAYALAWAKARQEAGEVKHWATLAVESIGEAIRDLPETMRDAAVTAFDAINPIPSLSGLATIVKWGSIGGGLFLLYWYVLRPRKKA